MLLGRSRFLGRRSFVISGERFGIEIECGHGVVVLAAEVFRHMMANRRASRPMREAASSAVIGHEGLIRQSNGNFPCLLHMGTTIASRRFKSYRMPGALSAPTTQKYAGGVVDKRR